VIIGRKMLLDWPSAVSGGGAVGVFSEAVNRVPPCPPRPGFFYPSSISYLVRSYAKISGNRGWQDIKDTATRRPLTRIYSVQSFCNTSRCLVCSIRRILLAHTSRQAVAMPDNDELKSAHQSILHRRQRSPFWFCIISRHIMLERCLFFLRTNSLFLTPILDAPRLVRPE
jgi:hypothetical protein